MPTGYTDILKDSNVTFEKFFKTCMRGMGACAMQRDEDISKEPELQKVSNYYAKKIKNTKRKLNNFKKLKSDKLFIRAFKEFKKLYIGIDNLEKESQKLLTNYNTMLEKVRAWTPPTKDHEKFKKFMIEQIESSIRFDCNTDYYKERKNTLVYNIVNFRSKNYKKDIVNKFIEDIEYYAKEYKSEIKNVKEINQWIIDALNSIKS